MREISAREIRERLAALAHEHRASLAELSRILGRGDGYMSRYIGDAVPYELAEADRQRLASYFGVDDRTLRPLPPKRRGIARPRWKPPERTG